MRHSSSSLPLRELFYFILLIKKKKVMLSETMEKKNVICQVSMKLLDTKPNPNPKPSKADH